jgi:hypothetical protein
LIHAACKDVREALTQRTTDLDKSVDDLRNVELGRLDKLFFGAYRQAVREGNLGAIDRALRIMERRAKYVPVEISQRLEVTGADGGPLHVETADLAELEALIAVTEEAAHGSDGQ